MEACILESALPANSDLEIMELSTLKAGLGEGATVLDPWLESHKMEAAAKASRWAVASKAHAAAQEKRARRSGGLMLGGSSGLRYLQVPRPIRQEAIPTAPRVEEEVDDAGGEVVETDNGVDLGCGLLV